MAGVRQARHRAAAGGFGIAGMPAGDHDLELARRLTVASPRRQQAGRSTGRDARSDEQIPTCDDCHEYPPPFAFGHLQVKNAEGLLPFAPPHGRRVS
jgi:hypothetical protein